MTKETYSYAKRALMHTPKRLGTPETSLPYISRSLLPYKPKRLGTPERLSALHTQHSDTEVKTVVKSPAAHAKETRNT